MRSSSRIVSCVSLADMPAVGSSSSRSSRVARQRKAEFELLLVAVAERAGDAYSPGRRGRSRRAARWSRRDRMPPSAPRNSRRGRDGRDSAACKFSNTVSLGKMLVRWNERPMPMRQMRCGGAPVMSRPSSRTVPLSGCRWPVIRLNSVDLPAPFGPITAAICRVSTVRLTSETARNPPKDLLSPLISSTAPTSQPDPQLRIARRRCRPGTRTAAPAGSCPARTASIRCRSVICWLSQTSASAPTGGPQKKSMPPRIVMIMTSADFDQNT